MSFIIHLILLVIGIRVAWELIKIFGAVAFWAFVVIICLRIFGG